MYESLSEALKADMDEATFQREVEPVWRELLALDLEQKEEGRPLALAEWCGQMVLAGYGDQMGAMIREGASLDEVEERVRYLQLMDVL